MTGQPAEQADAMAELLAGSTGVDIAPHFSCGEADQVAEFITAFRGEAAGRMFLHCHSEADGPGQDHYQYPAPEDVP